MEQPLNSHSDTHALTQYNPTLAALVKAKPFASARPRSAVDMRIVPCRDEQASPWGGASHGWGANSGAAVEEQEEEDDTLDQHTVSEIFHQMGAAQRDKIESR